MISSVGSDWIEMTASPEEVARERARARELRASPWWKNQLATGICHYCGKHFPPSELTMDHVIPVARGGKSDKGNVVPACHACNRDKKYLTPGEIALASLQPEVETRKIEEGRHVLGTLLIREGEAVVVDPLDADAVMDALSADGLGLCAIFVTGENPDGGEICDRLHVTYSVPVIGPEESGDMELDRIVEIGEDVVTPVATFTVEKDGDRVAYRL